MTQLGRRKWAFKPSMVADAPDTPGLYALWDGERLLPEGWVDHGRTVRSVDPKDGDLYGAHWWVDHLDTDRGTFRASGYEGQMVAICPALDAIVVRLGHTPEPQPTPAHLPPWRKRVLDALEA